MSESFERMKLLLSIIKVLKNEMASRSKVNGQNKKMFNNFLDSIEIGNNITQVNLRGGRG
jgi:hypothetical protein